MSRLRIDWTLVLIVLIAVGLSVSAPAIPGWIRYVGETSLAEALAAVGVMILLRAGLLSFGQGLFYFLGGYSAALLGKYAGITDAIAAVLAAAVCGGAVAAALGFFIARYRGIFFSMLTLAVSMIVYGIATKLRIFGGSDGLNVRAMSVLGYHPHGSAFQMATFIFSVWTCALFGIGAHIIDRSRLGMIIAAIDQNEIRLEYLGRSVRGAIHAAYVVAGVVAGAGGALAAISAQHVDPQFAYWTTAGDFIFIALLGGHASVLSPFLGALVLEILRTFSSALFPDQWQLALGAVMLAIVLFLPDGLSHLPVLLYRALKRPAAATPPERHGDAPEIVR
jgi:branched-chain amino acid transport system permease protein